MCYGAATMCYRAATRSAARRERLGRNAHDAENCDRSEGNQLTIGHDVSPFCGE
jgi:hypothetical protein